MLATLVALAVSAAPAHIAPELSVPLVLAKKKKKRPPAKPGEKEPPAETSEGLDLTEDTAPATPVTETHEPEPVALEAAPPPKSVPSGWSAVTAHTAGEGGNLVFAEVGWPGVAAGYWRGILGSLDVGARIGFNWSYEAMVTRPVLGMRFQVQARYLLFESGGLSLAVNVSPGALLYFFASGPRAGVILPIGATLGLPELVSKLKLAVSLEVPIWLVFGFTAVVPIVAGVHAEYPLSDSLVAFVRLRPAGVSIWTGVGVFYTFDALAGVAFHL